MRPQAHGVSLLRFVMNQVPLNMPCGRIILIHSCIVGNILKSVYL